MKVGKSNEDVRKVAQKLEFTVNAELHKMYFFEQTNKCCCYFM